MFRSSSWGRPKSNWCHSHSFNSWTSSPSHRHHRLHLQTAKDKEQSSQCDQNRWKCDLRRLLRPRSEDGGGGHQRLLLLWLRSWNWNKQDNRQQSLLWVKNCIPWMIENCCLLLSKIQFYMWCDPTFIVSLMLTIAGQGKLKHEIMKLPGICPCPGSNLSLLNLSLYSRNWVLVTIKKGCRHFHDGVESSRMKQLPWCLPPVRALRIPLNV